jgi:hypothetical protein
LSLHTDTGKESRKGYREAVAMPLSGIGKKVLRSMEKEYGKKKGKSVFYAMEHTNPKWVR